MWPDLLFRRTALAAVWGIDCQKRRPNAGRQDKNPVQQSRWTVMGNNVSFPNTDLACLLFKKAVVLSCIRGFLAGVSLTSGSRSSHCQEPPIVCGLDCLPQVSPQPLPASGPDTRFRILVLADHLVYHCLRGLWLAALFFYSILTLWSLPCPTALPCLLVPSLSAYRLVLPTCFCLPSHSLGFIPLLLRTPATSPHTRALPWLPWPVCFLSPVCSACSTFHARFYHVQKNSFPNTCCCFLPGVSYVATNDWAENLTTKMKSNSTWAFFFSQGISRTSLYFLRYPLG